MVKGHRRFLSILMKLIKGCSGFDKGYSGFDKVWELNYFHSQMGFRNLFLVFLWVFWGLWGGFEVVLQGGNLKHFESV